MINLRGKCLLSNWGKPYEKKNNLRTFHRGLCLYPREMNTCVLKLIPNNDIIMTYETFFLNTPDYSISKLNRPLTFLKNE